MTKRKGIHEEWKR